MPLKETMSQLGDLLGFLTKDLMKAHRGNKAAAQRIRVGTVQLERVAKIYRKESVSAEKTKKSRLASRKKR